MNTGGNNTLLPSLAGQDGGLVMRNIYPYISIYIHYCVFQ